MESGGKWSRRIMDEALTEMLMPFSFLIRVGGQNRF